MKEGIILELVSLIYDAAGNEQRRLRIRSQQALWSVAVSASLTQSEAANPSIMCDLEPPLLLMIRGISLRKF